VWLVFGAAVNLAGVMFALATMRLEWLSLMVPALAGAALMATGAIQLTAWKMSGLRQCRISGCAKLPSGDALKAGWCLTKLTVFPFQKAAIISIRLNVLKRGDSARSYSTDPLDRMAQH
jgi:hypothetical protein